MKRSILLGITISLLLLALPAAASDHTLGIFGNSNEDETINMQDVTYTELIILEYRDRTELADAKYDSKINMQDVTQIELVILGKEKELTIVDSADRTVTVKKPVERIVVTVTHHLEMLRSLGVEESRVVGVSGSVINDEPFFPEYKDKPIVESTNSETIMSQRPDVVLLLVKGRGGVADLDKVQDELESVGITVIRVYCGGTGKGDIPMEAKMLGYVLGNRDEADEFIDWYENIINSIKTTVDGIEDDDKPKVYFEAYNWYALADSCTHTERAGGKNIFPDAHGYVSPESVMKEKPDIIVKYSMGTEGRGGYHMAASDTTELEEIREEIMSRDGLRGVVPAVQGAGRVYVITGHVRLCAGGNLRGFFLQPAYQAKWFHPELFEDLDPKAIHQEYLTKFQGLDIDLDENGVFVYPPLEAS